MKVGHMGFFPSVFYLPIAFFDRCFLRRLRLSDALTRIAFSGFRELLNCENLTNGWILICCVFSRRIKRSLKLTAPQRVSVVARIQRIAFLDLSFEW